MATFMMDLPPQMSGTKEDTQVLRTYLARLVDRLLYALNHIDAENITQGGIREQNLYGGSTGILEAAIANIGTANIGTANVQHLRAQVAEMVTAVIRSAVIDWARIARLEAAVAQIADAEIGSADIGFAQIKDADIENLIAHDAVTDRYFIDKLMVRNAQLVAATIGELVLKAADDNYYRLEVDPDSGTVTPVLATVTAGEIAAGVTSDGHATIIETDLTVADLSASSFKAMTALIDKITASRIDVSELFARQAVIDSITTGQIAGLLGSSLNLSSNVSIISNVTSTETWNQLTSSLDDAASLAATAALDVTEAKEMLEQYSASSSSNITQLWDAINMDVKQQLIDLGADNNAIINRVTSLELSTERAETAVQDLVNGIGTHFIIEPTRIRITQDQAGNWEQQLTADQMSFVNTRTGTTAASFGVNGAMTDRLRSNQELSVGTTADGWFDMVSQAGSGVADKWRSGTKTKLPPLVITQPTDAHVTWQSGSHPVTGSTAWPESFAFTVMGERISSYKWQYRPRHVFGVWTDTSATDRTYTAAFNSYRVGYEYRCKLTGTDGSVIYTETVRPWILGAPAVLQEPQQAVEPDSSGASVSLVASDDVTSYQWQTSSSMTSNTWSSVSGGTSATATIPASTSWARARCVLTGAGGICVSDMVLNASA